MLFGDGAWDWGSNDVAHRDGNALFFYQQHWSPPTGDYRYPFDFGVVPFPLGPDNQSGSTFFRLPGGWIMLNGTDNPSAVYQIFEEYMNWWGADHSFRDNAAIEYVATRFNRMDDVMRINQLATFNGRFELGPILPGFEMWRVVIPVITGEMTAAPAGEAYRQLLQEALDSFFQGS